MRGGIRNRIVKYTFIIIIGINLISLSVMSYFVVNNVKEESINDVIDISNRIKYVIGNRLIKKEDIYLSLDDIYYMGVDYVGIYGSSINVSQSMGSILNNEEINKIYKDSNNIKSYVNVRYIERDYIITYNYPIYEDNFVGNVIMQKSYIKDFSQGIDFLKIVILNQFIVNFLILLFINKSLFKIVKPIIDLKKSINSFINGEEDYIISLKNKDEIYDLNENYLLLKNKIISDRKRERDFLSNSTHELKTPITAIYAYGQLLQNNEDKEFTDKAISRILEESKKLISLIENLLFINKKNYSKNKFEEVNITSIVLGIIRKEEEIERNIDFDIKRSKEDFIMNGNKEEIECILHNLLDNSIKYSADNKVDIEVENNELIIRNSIYEIPDEIKNRLFEPFIKYNKNKKAITSSGFGLYMAKELSDINSLDISYTINNEKIVFKLENRNYN